MKPLHKYIIKRLISYFGTLFGAITITFFLFRLMPGNPLDAFIGSLMATQYVQAEFARQVIEEYKATFGLEGSLLTQYLCFLKQLVRGNLGPSLIAFPNPAQVVILKRLPWTIGLLGLSTIISWVLGVVIGTLAAWRRESKFDRVISNLAIILSQIPYYIMAVVLVLVFSYILGWFPSRGAYDPGLTPGLTLDFIISVIKHGFLPALSLVLTQSFGWLLSSRYLTISILAEDFLIFAEAKGLKPRRIFQRYVFRNILLP
ncbi:ABC transporter permease, partial [Candidatus Woesearchaeota archaeon]